jgi:Peptidase family M23
MKRVVALLPVLIAFQAGAPPALAWTWPADGPVLQPFVLGDDPYAADQHRGVDIAATELVRAPVSGTVSFAGTVPGGGRTVTIRTADGYSVTLVHLGTFTVARGQQVVEGGEVGSAGRSGRPEHAESYVHLGVRVTADPNGYVDPLGLLPSRQLPSPSPAPPAEQVPDAPEPPPTPDAPAVPAPTPEVPAPAPARPAVAPAAPDPDPKPAAIPAAGRPRAVSGAGGDPAEAGRPVPTAAGPSQLPAAIEKGLETGFELPTTLAPDASPPHGLQAPRAGENAGKDRSLTAIATLAALGLAGVGGLALARRRGDLGCARAADAAPPVLRDRTGRAAEDAAVAWTAEEDGLVADGDLERVSLGQPEPLADLDWDDDPSQLIQVPDDPGCRLPASATRRRFHHVVSRPPRHRGRSAQPAAHPIR